MQMELFKVSAEEFQEELERRTGFNIELTITDNSASILSFKSLKRKSSVQLRIHHMFLNAGPRVISALGTWLTHRRHRKSGAVLDEFICGHEHMIRGARLDRMRLRTRGRVHDLQHYYDAVNEKEFDGTITSPITWGRAAPRKRQRSIRLGSYSPEDDLIRIHPHLDQRFVPDYFVRYIVFHEMLHAFMGVGCTASGRRRIHPPEFKQREQAFIDYDEAMEWHDARNNLHRLLKRPA